MWEQDLVFGEEGEDKVYNFLRKKQNVRHITDCTKDKYFQERDIDFLVETTDGVVNKVEVKNDRQADNTGNIVYETKSNNNEGCLKRSHADIVFYVSQNHTYWFKLETLKKYLNMTSHKEISGGDNAKMYLLNIQELIRSNVLYEINY